jgi:hypothetical protein
LASSAASEFVCDFDPQLMVLFGPDHYDGFSARGPDRPAPRIRAD